MFKNKNIENDSSSNIYKFENENVLQDDTTNKVKCSNCGALVDSNVCYCWKCGSIMNNPNDESNNDKKVIVVKEETTKEYSLPDIELINDELLKKTIKLILTQ